MEIKTATDWDDHLWRVASPLYMEAFGDKGAKPTKIIQNMFAKEMAELHVGYNKSTPVVMALTGKLEADGMMIIDYLTVSENERGHGLGKLLIAYIRKQAMTKGYKNLIVEVESEETSDNKRRIDFWRSCGFFLTEYVHHYIWVPETYQAMYLPLVAGSGKLSGEDLFVSINTFHRKSFRLGG
ncbi:hypothetical protein JCM9140_1518 [Halalkalibacter wakoensis JCM 9140]|uniref:N-acetyltransferase domain-containing protein n=1 Tax=Halalkalibacter wakoensis JCM 9140 TaxID=1236970 RepID=W4Q1D6_9BACI|nr:GNAT family N-acetyltransferase [Halalkalibacter wakoensis]GAE25518.1 hypothetical protein JCM9140_1518 [Halalkalibacter wakoensis JCM 9140]